MNTLRLHDRIPLFGIAIDVDRSICRLKPS
jgi:hypothetical protein